MLLRVVPEEGQDVLPEDSTPWAKELPSATSHSNRSLRTFLRCAFDPWEIEHLLVTAHESTNLLN
jgi:hypothetical protein